ncbi:hypothetical protein SAMN05216474_2738 [Lishizhenia tianjinensis]|uniref:Uncharacterized protein n=1 Tax=Lishizhenia tianjinensis TaxID=477690 RepID=A0A1I7BEH9_9FLAO|nr:hypothetical protein SAMN05216474_2738 [Lishizhenia tianjinensis]
MKTVKKSKAIELMLSTDLSTYIQFLNQELVK